MAEYIDRQAAIRFIRDKVSLSLFMKRSVDKADKACMELCDMLNRDLPSADVVPVRHGRWQITDAYPHNVYCSECHKRFAQTHWTIWEDGSLPREYCPNCGARMDGEKDE